MCPPIEDAELSEAEEIEEYAIEPSLQTPKVPQVIGDDFDVLDGEGDHDAT